MKRFLSLLISFALYFTAFANDEILLLADEPPENFEIQPSRSTDPSVTAFIDELTISLDLSVLADCEYSVTDSSTEAVICSGRFPAGATTVFNMPAGTPSGTYRLSVYAYGCWWSGTFVI